MVSSRIFIFKYNLFCKIFIQLHIQPVFETLETISISTKENTLLNIRISSIFKFIYFLFSIQSFSRLPLKKKKKIEKKKETNSNSESIS